MEISNVADEYSTASDASLETIATAMAEKDPPEPIRLRLPIQLWSGKNYMSWRQQVWKVEVKTQAEAVEFKAALEIFFRTLYRCGSARTVAALMAEQEQE